MRTNVVLNDDLVGEAMRLSGARSKRAVIEEALRVFVEVKATEQAAAGYRERLRRLDDRLRGLRLRESPSAILRQERDRR
jgi:Arc/MetJ family transcription regulator